MLVILAPEAVQNLRELAAYAAQFSATTRLNLLAAITNKIRLLEQQLEMYPVVVGRAPFRRYVVTATVSLYYSIQADTIEVLPIVDSRRDPDTLLLPPA